MMMMKITTLQRPLLFIEEQVKGDLQHYKHEHHFKAVQNGTIVIDILEFGTPKDVIGKIFGKVYFKKYLEELLRKRTARSFIVRFTSANGKGKTNTIHSTISRSPPPV